MTHDPLTPMAYQAAAVLAQHPSNPAMPSMDFPNGGNRCASCPGHATGTPNSYDHALHQAQALADAGLLRTPFELSKVEVHQTHGQQTFVHIEREGVTIAHGYIEGPRATPAHPQIGAQAPREQPNGTPRDSRPVEVKMRALADDMADTPMTAMIVRQFADEVAALRNAPGGPYDLLEITAGWPETVQRSAERERRVRALAESLWTEAERDDEEIVRSIVRRLRGALDLDTTAEGK
jgi:hypothetical protein